MGEHNMPDAICKCHLNNTKALPECSRLKQVLQPVITGILLLVTLLFLLPGVASVTETHVKQLIQVR